MNKNKVILVEWINGDNEWAWYGIYTNGTIEQALKVCHEESDYDEDDDRSQKDRSQKLHKGEWESDEQWTYLGDYDIRAMEITLLDLSK